ncbi:MAG: hypothetical protein ACE5HR_02680 [bacterium]
MSKQKEFIYKVRRDLPGRRRYLGSDDPVIEAIRASRKILGLIPPSRGKILKEVEDRKNKILKKYSIKLKRDPLTGQQLIVRARNKEKADRRINRFTHEINEALYRKYGVKDLSCEYSAPRPKNKL